MIPANLAAAAATPAAPAAIHRAGGPEILEACREIVAKQGGCKTGQAVITTAGKLPSRFVIHTVGPIWTNGKNQEGERLRECYRNSLSLAVANGCTSVAFPNISTGVYRFPKEEAAKIAVREVRNFLASNATIQKVLFVCFDEENFRLVGAEVKG